MGDLSDESSPMDFEISAPSIRLLETDLVKRIKDLDNEIIDGNILEVLTVCNEIKEKILDHEDEYKLSKVYNNYRRINIASDLLFSICSLHDRIVEIEFSKTVRDLLEIEKFRNISRRILKKRHLDLKKEKYFAKEADAKILKSLEDKTSLNGDARPAAISPSLLQQEAQTEHLEDTHQQDLIDNVDLHLTEHTNQTLGNLTEIRGEVTTEIPHLRGPSEGLVREDSLMPLAQSDISIGEPSVGQQIEQDLNDILQTLEDQAGDVNVGQINQPESPLEVRDLNLGTAEVHVGGLADVPNQQNGETQLSDELKLSSLESIEEVKRKRARPIMDEKTYISNYAARALYLNRNISIQRVQVFQGPPQVIQSVSVDYLMKMPGFRNSLFQKKRNAKLNELYNRHLILEKKCHEPLNGFPRRTELERQHIAGPKSLPRIIDTAEERVGMRSSHERRDVLMEVVAEVNQPEPPVVETVQNLNGLSMSRLLPPPIEPSALENIILAPQKSSSPRVQQLQGTRPDPKKSPPWFVTTKRNPPSPKWREFKYVSEKLQELWSLLETQGIEKSVTVHEFLVLNDSYNKADYLTLLRVVDKLSLQRKLLLEYKQDGIYIKPFEVPFISSKQLSLKEKEPRF